MSQYATTGKSGGKSPSVRSTILVALGSNAPYEDASPRAIIQSAIEVLADLSGAAPRVSRFFATPAFPPGSGPAFVNAALAVEVGWSPQEALAHLHSIESTQGRVRAVRWGQRTLDLDLIACGATVLPDARTHAQWRDLDPQAQRLRAPQELILPHPRVQDRAFVLVPLMDVAPEWVHPLLGRSVREMYDALPPEALAEVKPL
ncbi:2-amino-4-hydroxy-6-hydroxymethyldihydropteridine diphosphokinase [Sulfitobacter albidus]|uniref:2-amino-4-hydroxy-6-hydroxymethyldihydropteridine pyrophosphokinase n=1 Tax=Sulfitobacter albidus TaxID=2829501 RepID=A0A975JCJ3_9RHOB|nr:2-amino-4-hydroxy-6-hydroxymethyldihydropteridine diphosphokinase [Sulfitobacter albidus]QUJ75760.1 2-amino-4-hydroxy-6-hydroxymethyldihydropteridine diphosphokinase [Sulfitobacter albidus]